MRHISASARCRPGITIVEVIVALMLVTIALLGMAGSATLALRATLDASRHRQAARLASSRLAQLAAGSCTRSTNGTAHDSLRGMDERFVISAPAGGFAIADDTVRFATPAGMRTITLTSAIPC